MSFANVLPPDTVNVSFILWATNKDFVIVFLTGPRDILHPKLMLYNYYWKISFHKFDDTLPVNWSKPTKYISSRAAHFSENQKLRIQEWEKETKNNNKNHNLKFPLYWASQKFLQFSSMENIRDYPNLLCFLFLLDKPGSSAHQACQPSNAPLPAMAQCFTFLCTSWISVCNSTNPQEHSGFVAFSREGHTQPWLLPAEGHPHVCFTVFLVQPQLFWNFS